MPRGEGGERRTVGSSTFILQGKTLPLKLVGSHGVPLPSQGKYRRGIYTSFLQGNLRGVKTRDGSHAKKAEQRSRANLCCLRAWWPDSVIQTAPVCLSVCLSVFETHVSNVKENDVIL